MDHFDDITCEEFYGPEPTEEDYDLAFAIGASHVLFPDDAEPEEDDLVDLAEQDARREFV